MSNYTSETPISAKNDLMDDAVKTIDNLVEELEIEDPKKSTNSRKTLKRFNSLIVINKIGLSDALYFKPNNLNQKIVI